MGVLVLSQYVEERYATELLAGSTRGVGYLLKDRVAEVREFVDAVVRVAQGVRRWTRKWSRSCSGAAVSRTYWPGSPRGAEVLGLMAEDAPTRRSRGSSW